MTTKSPSRWLRFSLRTMFVVVTLLCCWLGWESSIVRNRQSVLKEMRAGSAVHFVTAEEWKARFPLGTNVSPGPSVPQAASIRMTRVWLGDEAIQEIWYAPHVVSLTDTDLSRLRRTFPEAELRREELPTEPCHPGCFPSGTLVDSPRGRRLIEAIEVGDVLTTMSPEGIASTAQVTSVFVTTNVLWSIHTEAGTLLTTKIQPLCLTDGKVKAAGELQPGDLVLHRENEEVRAVQVLDVSSTERTAQVFNVVLGDSEVFVAGGYLARSKPPLEIAAK